MLGATAAPDTPVLPPCRCWSAEDSLARWLVRPTRARSGGREMHPGGKRKEKEKGEKKEKKKGEREKRERERKEEEGLVVYAVFDFLMYAR